MTAPTITADFDGDCGSYRLYATSYSKVEPAGERLFRGGDLPDIQFLHEDEATAIKDAAILQAYLNAAYSGKAPKARGREEKEVVGPKKVAGIENAVWMK